MEGLIERNFIKKIFAHAYKKLNIDVPDIKYREFGIGDFGKKIAKRHLWFPDINSLRDYLIANPPIYISYSAAYYQKPYQSMSNKLYMKSDLIMDIDQDLEQLDYIKQEVVELYDILKFEFGMKNITINYSGNRGFHIHIRDEWAQMLSREARAEILDYLTLRNVKLDNFNIRIVNGKKQGIGFGDVKNKMQARILKELRYVTGKEKVLLGDWEDVDEQNFALAIERARFKLNIDSNVTLDTTKLLRMENSIHGDTGFIAKILNIDQIEKFDPWADATVFNDIDIRIKMVDNYKEYRRDEVYRVVGHIGVFLLLQNKAKLII